MPFALGEVGSLPTVDCSLGQEGMGAVAEYIQHAREVVQETRRKAGATLQQHEEQMARQYAS